MILVPQLSFRYLQIQPAATPNVLAPGAGGAMTRVAHGVAHGVPGLCWSFTSSGQKTDGFGALFSQELRRDLKKKLPRQMGER